MAGPHPLVADLDGRPELAPFSDPPECGTGELAVRLRLGSPSASVCANGQLVKTLIDGFLTALHAQEDGPALEMVGRRLEVLTGVPARDVRSHLLGPEPGALGRRRQLVGLRGSGVQCHPDDLRVGSLLVEIVRPSRAWTLSGQVCLRSPATPGAPDAGWPSTPSSRARITRGEEISVAVRRFRHNDEAYLEWREAHLGDGFIANIVDSNSAESRIHRASCSTLQIPIDKGRDLTGPYWKACSTDVAELRRALGPIRSCARCG